MRAPRTTSSPGSSASSRRPSPTSRKKFEDSAQSIDSLNSAETARKEIEELRDHVGRLLGAVADNGAVFSLGDKALNRAEDKLKALERRRATSRKTGSS